MKEKSESFLYWNRSSWVCRLNLLPADSGDPSGARRSVHQECSRACWYESWEPSAEFNNVSHFFFFWLHTDSPHGKKGKKRHKQPWSCVQSQSISQAKSHRLSFGKVGCHLRLSGPAHPAGQWQRINQTSSSSSRGLSFTHLISHRAAHKPDCPASRYHSVNKNPCTKHHAQYGWFCSAGPSDRGQTRL